MALVPGRFARLAAKRRLRRNESSDTHPVEMAPVLCIRGAVRKAWMVLPVQEKQGRSCVTVSNNAPWLMHLLGGTRFAKHHRGAVANFVQECAMAFAEASSQSQPASGQNEQLAPLADAASSQVVSRKRGRNRIMDSDDEAEVAVPSVLAKPKPKARIRRQRRTRRGEFVNLTIRNFSLTFTLASGPKMLVPVEGTGIQNIVDDLLPRRTEVRKHVSMSSDDVKEHLTEVDKGRLLWRSPSWDRPGCWTICYRDAAGERMRSSAGLRVPRTSLAGEVLELKEVTHAALQVLKKARREWNRLDQSDAERYVL